MEELEAKLVEKDERYAKMERRYRRTQQKLRQQEQALLQQATAAGGASGDATEGGGARMLNDTVMRLEEESGPVTFEKLVGAMHEAWEWAAKAAPRRGTTTGGNL